jgi:hypothetical protein
MMELGIGGMKTPLRLSEITEFGDKGNEDATALERDNEVWG